MKIILERGVHEEIFGPFTSINLTLPGPGIPSFIMGWNGVDSTRICELSPYGLLTGDQQFDTFQIWEEK